MCERIFSKLAKFSCSRAAFKSSLFATFDGYEVFYDTVVVLGLF